MLSDVCLKMQSMPNSGLPASAHLAAMRLMLASSQHSSTASLFSADCSASQADIFSPHISLNSGSYVSRHSLPLAAPSSVLQSPTCDQHLRHSAAFSWSSSPSVVAPVAQWAADLSQIRRLYRTLSLTE